MPIVTVRPGGVVVRLRPGETVLEGLYRSGYAYRTGCRRGGCGVCKVDLVAGEVDYHHTIAASVLTERERGDGTCLTCRAVPTGDITITLRDGDSLRRTNSLLALLHRSAPAGDPAGAED